MVLISSFDSRRILMIFFFFFFNAFSLLCIHFYSKLFFLFDYFDLSFSCWLFFLRCLVLLSCFIFKSGGWKALIGNSETVREVNHLCALLQDDVVEQFSCEDTDISIFRVFTLGWSDSAENDPPFTCVEMKDGCWHSGIWRFLFLKLFRDSGM